MLHFILEVMVLNYHYGHMLRILHWCTDQSMTSALETMDLTAAQGHIMAYLAHRETPPCPRDIDIAMVNKLYDLATMQDFVPDSVRAHYEGLEAHAGDCIGCKACEARCPFGVKIAERMVKAGKILGQNIPF